MGCRFCRHLTQTCPSGELRPDGGAEAPREQAAGGGRCQDPPVPAVLPRVTCLAAGAPSPVRLVEPTFSCSSGRGPQAAQKEPLPSASRAG